jgi:D-glycero-D-manno-heptose 1,7-bisphosphate phosphatase
MCDADTLTRYRLCIFDADGTLRRTTVPGQPCPRAPDEWELLPRVREVLSAIAWGAPGAPLMGIASNQDQVGAGLLTSEMAEALLRDLARAATGRSAPDGALRFCPHALGVQCDCRKPGDGLLRGIMEMYGIAPEDTVFVGDSESDRLAAARAGVDFVEAEALFRWTQTA